MKQLKTTVYLFMVTFYVLLASIGALCVYAYL